MVFCFLSLMFLPLIGAVVNGLLLRDTSGKRAGVIATLFSFLSFTMALSLFVHIWKTSEPVHLSIPWFEIGRFAVSWGFQSDALTAVMALVVTGVGTVIHLYSIGYMSEDSSPSRYFAYLNFFLFNMLLLISADNLLVLFVGWEGVGLCSYLLIGYWYEDLKNSNAGIKAFIVNRIGDAGFLIGIFFCFYLFGSLDFGSIAKSLSTSSFDWRLLNFAALGLFIGAMGKSAQLPLHVWLPDAMAGPTPVSALIHAATMVTAGVYMVARLFFLFQVAHETALFITTIGIITSLFTAVIATSQNDIKKVLAYSTISQLGLMFVALGVGAYPVAIFHLFTHAFFKALLFLGAGSVIHALDGEQDILRMGGLRKYLPWTFSTFFIATLAIAGIPPLSGFFSKDAILYSTFLSNHGFLLWILGLLVSALTAFYMARLFTLVFLGTPRTEKHPHECPKVMWVPLCILAFFSAFAGFLGTPHEWHLLPHYFENFLSPVLPLTSVPHSDAPITEGSAMAIATFAAIGALLIGTLFYRQQRKVSYLPLEMVRTIAANRFWVDELYSCLIVQPFRRMAQIFSTLVDGSIIDGVFTGAAGLAQFGSSVLSALQLGLVQIYLLIMTIGGVGIVWWMMKGQS